MHPFRNVYDDVERARAYADLEFPGTYYLAFRDIPALVARHVQGDRALDFGCGTGRSSRFLRELSFTVIGVDISEAMITEARRRDPSGDYRLVRPGHLGAIEGLTFDLLFAAFTFDNIPTDDEKAASLVALRKLLAPAGRLIAIVSSPEIYRHEWASFSTKDFPANAHARDGDRVQIIMLDVPDRRPVEDVVCSDDRYRRLFATTGWQVHEMLRPLGTAADGMRWVTETTIAPWSVYAVGA
jgi:SAM-dependent methyltransferase